MNPETIIQKIRLKISIFKKLTKINDKSIKKKKKKLTFPDSGMSGILCVSGVISINQKEKLPEKKEKRKIKTNPIIELKKERVLYFQLSKNLIPN